LLPLTRESPERRRQLDAFATLDRIMEIGRETSPSERAAEIVADVIAGAQAARA
jgi:lipid-A-disaccharide synthase